MIDSEFYKFPGAMILPCGKMAYNEEHICGYPAYRCSTCFTIFGSIACPCNHLKEKVENEKEN